MSLHHLVKNHSIDTERKDPGSGGTLVVDRQPCYFGLTSAAAETRTLARPTQKGVVVTVAMDTDGGDITLTVTGGYNEAGTTTFVFANAGEFATFVSIEVGGTFVWRKLGDSLSGGGTSPTQSDALTPATGGTLDTTYGQAELDEINNMIVRIGEIEAALEAAGIIAAS